MEATKMESYQTLQKQISYCKAHEANGHAEYIKAQFRGIRRDLEYKLDENKADIRENHKGACWN